MSVLSTHFDFFYTFNMLWKWIWKSFQKQKKKSKSSKLNFELISDITSM